MKDLKKKILEQYKQLNNLLDNNSKKQILKRRHTKFKNEQQQELITGAVIVILIIVILLSFTYYFLVFAPEQDKIANLKQEKINEVNKLFPGETDSNKQSLLSKIESKNSIEELESIDVNSMAYPMLKKQLLDDINNMKDNYNRVELVSTNYSDIMSTDNAAKYINSSDAPTLASLSVKSVDSVIVPLSITRKQAASGLIKVGDTVDVYTSKHNTEQLESTESNTTNNDTNNSNNTKSKLTGGSKVVSILRSKDSGNIEKNIELTETPKNRNLTQSSLLDVQEVMESKAAGTYDEKQVKILVDEYASRLSDYERTSQLGDLDVEYIVMIEVPRSSVESLLSDMDNLILTIPTYDAPSWIKL